MTVIDQWYANGKTFNNDNSEEFGAMPNPSEMWRRQHNLPLLKILPLAYLTTISWPPPWILHLFSQWPSSGPHTFFYS